MEIVLLLIGLGVGFAVGFLLAKSKKEEVSGSDDSAEQLQRQLLTNAKLEEANSHLKEERDRLISEASVKDQTINTLNGRIEASIAKFQEQEKNIKEQREQLAVQFENMANKILEEKSEKFTKSNKENIEAVLKPLRENIEKFEKKVEEKYDFEQKERASLKGEIKLLHDLNQKISKDAHNLTTALKGDSKKQGNWGELILERVLENSGLTKGLEFTTQETTYNEAGERLQPDVVVHLPDSKHLIIDSKVSLVAYEQFVNAEDEADRESLIKAHIVSVKNHVKGLSEKNYHTGRGLDSPEFVLMFMPIESSFSLSIKADDELFNYAWDKRIVIVGPSTLLATLRTVASIWKQDRQTRNAVEIANKSGKLYDKFVGFVEDMEKIGDRLSSTQKVYEEGMKKLSEGRGNLVGKAEELKTMGAKATKSLSNNILENQNED